MSKDIKLAASSYGDVGNPIVIALHGAGQTRHSWHRSAQAIADGGYYVICLDSRGHGESDWSVSGDYSIDSLIGDLHAVVDLLNNEKPAVVGASLGGITALLAQGESERSLFSLLALVDITPSVDMRGVARILDFMARFNDGFSSLEAAAAAVAEYKNKPASSDASGLAKNLRLRENGRYYWHWDPALLNHVGQFDECIMERQRIAARNLSIPVQLVHGKLSEIVSDSAAAEFLQLVPHAEYVDVAHASHMLATDANDVFATAVMEFLHKYHRF